MIDTIFQEIINKKKGKKYDVAVMYSGGKDSSYLLYLLKEVYKLRVVAVNVDSGYEFDESQEKMKRFTDRMDVELVQLSAMPKEFKTMYRMLITENEYFRRERTNHICFICNNVLWCRTCLFAYENDIPFVASGLSIEQLSSGRPYPLEADRLANSIAEKSTRHILKNAIAGFHSCSAYSHDGLFADFIDKIGESVSKVSTVYPYIYHSVSVEEQKRVIDLFGWEPPNGQSKEQYVSSGCKIMRYIIKELEKTGLIVLNEREQTKAMVEKGLIDEKELAFANYNAEGDVVNLSHPLFEELGIKEYLLNLCREKNKPFTV